MSKDARSPEDSGSVSSHCSDAAAYAEAALVAMSGVVCTPEKGYVIDGGPSLMRSDMERMIKEFQSKIKRLESENQALRGQVSSLQSRVSHLRGVANGTKNRTRNYY